MTHSLATLPCTPISTLTISSSLLSSSKPSKICNLSSSDVHPTSLSYQCVSSDTPVSSSHVSRRNVIALSIGGVILGLNVGEEKAWAGARRPPPPPAGEKKDPNVNGVLAKVIASRKRKEAMKEAMAKQREMGKKVEE